MMRFCMLFILMLLAGCQATPVDSRIPGYLTTPDGQLLFNEHGECWRTAAWRPAFAVPQCDPEVARRQRLRAEPEPDEAPLDRTAMARPVEEEWPVEDDVVHHEAEPEPEPEMSAERPFRLDADASFHFGHHRLSLAGERAVDQLAVRIRLRRAGNLHITLTGHTDRIGTRAANQQLSEQRAAAVKARLVEQGLPAEAITVQGRGPDQPLTEDGECPQDLVICELIACLAPDRRVDVVVTGIQTR
ncbi:OmpA family protein [Isoalcanivorax indicus]|uniref:OmpA family protein n=1 Tax=Isoalcanivorax indicus TaxID=2202653 RepID=UPI0013C4A485|nr:OmpA family protein [Isoalcanivorax indicus]